MSVDKIQISREVKMPSYDIPVTRKDILQTLSAVPEEDLEGLCKVVIASPRRNEEFGFFGRYDSQRSVIYLFAQLRKGESYLVGQYSDLKMSSSDLKTKILDDTLLHEISHHVGSKYGDLSEGFADNYVKKIRKKIELNGGK